MSTFTPPTIEAIEHAAKEGLEAAQQGRHFNDACPYTFSQFPGIEQGDFDVTKRPLLNAWFSAWKRASKQ